MLKWIDVKQLRVGMFVCEIDAAWMDNPFWGSKVLLRNGEDLQRIRSTQIKRVRIDTAQGLDVADDPGLSKPLAIEPEGTNSSAIASAHASMSDELVRAARICASGKENVMTMFQEARLGNVVNISNVLPLVEEISASVSRHPTALISLARIKTKDNYTYLHSMAVCALMVALARQLKLDDAQCRSAALAGLLHDIGKAGVSLEVLNKPGKLTAAEYREMQKHPAVGYALLLESQGVDDIVLDVCLHHHEKIDGTGYPQGLHDESISLHAKMGAVCDVYDAVTSDRPYKTAWDPAESIHNMAEWTGHFDAKVFSAFVKALGIYPIGSLVRLESGRLAIVIEQNKKSLIAPKVRVFYSTRTNCYLMPETLDLGRAHCVEKIVARESPEDWGLGNLGKLWSDIAGVQPIP